jgi:hypothetical protein
MRIDSAAESTPPAAGGLRREVDRILHSTAFAGSELLRLLLSFLADRAMETPGEHVKVKEIATRVFGRSDNFDSQTDSVVRVHIGRLRAKLAEYYVSEGAEDEIVLEVPKGAYFLAWHSRHPQPPTAESPVTPPVAVGNGSPAPLRRSRWVRFVMPVTTALSLLLAAGLAIENHRLASGAAKAPLPWSAIEMGDLRIPIVVSDMGVGLAQDIGHEDLSLKEYINHNYLARAKPVGRELNDLARTLCLRELTSLADAEIASRIVRLDPVLSERAIVRSARNMNMEDFTEGSSILIGSYRACHWVELFQNELNFNVEYDGQKAVHFCRNRSPRAGEQEIYRPAGPTGTSGEGYAVVALIPNHNGQGNALLITGTNMESTQAAGDFVTNKERCSRILRSMGIDPQGPPRYFEILLKVKAIAGSVDRSSVLAYRTVPYRSQAALPEAASR